MGFIVHFTGCQVRFQYILSGFCRTFSGIFFWYFLGWSGELGARQGVRCILRTVSPPIVCPGLLVLHVGGPFRQISGMEVGEGMAGPTSDCALSVLLHIAL